MTTIQDQLDAETLEQLDKVKRRKRKLEKKARRTSANGNGPTRKGQQWLSTGEVALRLSGR